MSDNSDAGTRIGVDALLALSGANRSAKAYAFLYAAFRKTEVSANPVRDALDCLAPFIASYTDSIVGKQVTANGIQSYLKRDFGFDIPLYAIEQLIPSLQNVGIVEYHKPTRVYLAKKSGEHFSVALAEIETDFDEVAAELGAFARSVGYVDAPHPELGEMHSLYFCAIETIEKGPHLQ